MAGDKLVAMYVTVRHPLSGTLLDGPALAVLVKAYRTAQSYVSELAAGIPEQTTYPEVFVYAKEERDTLTLRNEDVVQI